MRPHTDVVIEDIAARQHGLATRGQLLAAAVPPGAIARRVRCGRLRPVQRGVYQVGPVAHAHAQERAALLAAGPGAVLSHRSAGVLWQILPAPAAAALIDVTVVATADRGRRPGIRAHRVRMLLPAEATVLEGLPVTTAVRTLLDLASLIDGRALEQAVARAERRDLVGRDALLALIAAHPRRTGSRRLRRLLARAAVAALTRSEAEELFLALVRRSGLRPPETNVFVAGYEVDFLWRLERVVVEVDGFAYHASRRQFEKDRVRDAVLAAEGFRVLRVTYRQLASEPEALLVRLTRALMHAER